jgi:type I restriction enzyme S subunit
MNSPDFFEQYKRVSSQTDMAEYVSLRDQRAMYVPLPPISTQQSIAKILGDLDDKVELLRQANVALAALVRAIFRAWFVDFAPVHAKASGAISFRGMPQDLFDLLPIDFGTSNMGKIPTGWTTEMLIDQADWVNGAAFKDMHFSNEPDALPVIKISELKKGISANTKFTNTDLGERYKIGTGDLLFSWSGSPETSIDAFIWAGGDAWLNQHIFAVRENGKKSKSYLFALLKHLMPEFIRIATNKQTTGLGHVTRKDMERMHVCLPQKPFLDWFSEFSGLIYAQTLSNLEQINALNSLLDTLLPKLILGEIEVPQIEVLTNGG